MMGDVQEGENPYPTGEIAMTYRNSLPLAGAPASSLPRQPAFLPLAAADTDDVATAPVSPTEGGDVRQSVQWPGRGRCATPISQRAGIVWRADPRHRSPLDRQKAPEQALGTAAVSPRLGVWYALPESTNWDVVTASRSPGRLRNRMPRRWGDLAAVVDGMGGLVNSGQVSGALTQNA